MSRRPFASFCLVMLLGSAVRVDAREALPLEDLSAEIVDRAKGLTPQNLASARVGSQMPAGQQANDFVTDEESGAKAGGTILVAGTKATLSCWRA